MLSAEAGLGGYQDVFFVYAVFALSR
jgi:hypothetical protein